MKQWPQQLWGDEQADEDPSVNLLCEKVAGMLAAASLYALDHNIVRLSEDHRLRAVTHMDVNKADVFRTIEVIRDIFTGLDAMPG